MGVRIIRSKKIHFLKGLVKNKIYLSFFVLGITAVIIGIAVYNTQDTKNRAFDTHSHAADAIPNCWPTEPLAGALPGQPKAIWCYTNYGDGPSTAKIGTNTWVDDFNHGLGLAKFDSVNYTDFPITGSLYKSQLWRHGDHWMRDMAGSDQGGEGSGGWNFGSAAMRPNATFKAENGQLTIEADVATRISAYGANLFWPEFVITTADKPTRIRSNGTYVYETFPNHWTFGCRLQNDGGFTCAILDGSDGGDSTARVTELSHFQCGNSPDARYSANYQCHSIYGGLPSNLPANIAQYSRDCKDADPDTNCRDRWRWEITENRSTWFVNGVKYMEHTDFDPGAKAAIRNLINQPVYVYFGEFLYKLDKPARMHWDRIAINPKDANGNLLPPSAAPGFCLPFPSCLGLPTTPPTATPTPCIGAGCPTATPTPTLTRTPTPSPTPTLPPAGSITVTFDDATNLTSQYPTGVLSWSGQPWMISGPFGQFATKNISFTQGPVQGSIGVLQSRTIISLQAYNGGNTATTVSISCAGNTTKTQSVATNTLATIQTGFTTPCSTVTLGSTNGWDTNFDNIVLSSTSANPTATSTPTPTLSPTPTTSPFRIGDINNDNKVDIQDLSYLLSKWNTADALADLNKDGRVNTLDLSLLLGNWR